MYEIPSTTGDVLARTLFDVLSRNGLSVWLNELGVLVKRSGKYKATFLAICESIEDDDDDLYPTVIKPLCATRWSCGLEPVRSAFDQYHVILHSLQEMASGVTDTATKANGLLDCFQKGKVFLGLTMVAKPVAILEQLNTASKVNKCLRYGGSG